MKQKIIIIGGGMAGCFMAICLAKRDYEVEIYESRPDVRKVPYDSGRSFNLTLYYRGIQAMKKAEIWEEVKKFAVIAEGNVAHYLERPAIFDPFDGASNEILYTIHRNQLNSSLLNSAEKFPNVKIFFDTKYVSIDKETKIITFQKISSQENFTAQAEVVIGADGVNSVVRDEIQKNQQITHRQEYEDWGYKEVHVSKELAEKMRLRNKATHTWPRADSLLIAFPNPDSSFTLMFNLPLEGSNSFAELITEEQIKLYITTYFPDLTDLLPDIVNAFLNKPTGKFVTIYTAPWSYEDFMVIIGDAAHGVIPFYGQGVCAAFDDCLVFTELIDKNLGDWKKIFQEFQNARKKNTDILGDLSKENFIELRDKSRSTFFILKDKTDTFLSRILPGLWLPPLYILIAHGDLEYLDAFNQYNNQQRLEKKYGVDVVLTLLARGLGMWQDMRKNNLNKQETGNS